jgi:hypothetical protein
MPEEKKSKEPAEPPRLPDFTELEQSDLTAEDMADIEKLLAQDQDVTRQDIRAQDFQSLLSRYIKE